MYADQEFLSDPAAGVVGDCWRACIANATGTPLDQVPHFVRDYFGEWLTETLAWLASHGHRPVVCVPAEFPITVSAEPHIILIGRSPRGHVHAVLADAVTGEILHDPHPSRDGLSMVLGAYVFVDDIPAAKDTLEPDSAPWRFLDRTPYRLRPIASGVDVETRLRCQDDDHPPGVYNPLLDGTFCHCGRMVYTGQVESVRWPDRDARLSEHLGGGQ